MARQNSVFWSEISFLLAHSLPTSPEYIFLLSSSVVFGANSDARTQNAPCGWIFMNSLTTHAFYTYTHKQSGALFFFPWSSAAGARAV
jgi:hypothetical protein